MKTKLKPVKLSAKRAVSTIPSRPVVPLRDRHLTFEISTHLSFHKGEVLP